MMTLRFPCHSASASRTPLRLPQDVEVNAVSQLQPRETAVSDDVISAFAIGDDATREGAHWVAPLSSRLCIVLIFLGAIACYSLGYAVFVAFRHLLGVLH